MNRKSFLFDLNKCVGCHACLVACTIENKTDPEIQWRDIIPFNPSGYPGIPLFHFSLACNHCQDAPCMKNCPALAYSSDNITGAIIHHAKKCIGCKYCTWACPYDAPKFNPQTGIIEKCTFCNHRITDDLKPACANLCPTGALDFIDWPEILEHKSIPGFTDAGINPSIKIIPPNINKPQLVCSENQIIAGPLKKIKQESKINLAHEWPLAIFTLIVTIMVSLFTGMTLDKIEVQPITIIVPGVLAIFLSMFHLGKKFRAWRSLLNVKNSWLSREILAFIVFFLLSSLHLLYLPDKILAWSVVAVGLICLISIDKIYELAIQPINIEIHSAHVFLSYFLFISIFINQYYAFAVIVVIKTLLYTYRKIKMHKMKKNIRLLLSGWRVDMLISFPVIFWIIEIPAIKWWIFASVLIGEIIDRAEYYDELDIITPLKQIKLDLSDFYQLP